MDVDPEHDVATARVPDSRSIQVEKPVRNLKLSECMFVSAADARSLPPQFFDPPQINIPGLGIPGVGPSIQDLIDKLERERQQKLLPPPRDLIPPPYLFC